MRQRAISRNSLAFIVLSACALFAWYGVAHAQTSSENQLRATIAQEVASDPRSKDLTPAQTYALVNELTLRAQQQGVTASQLTYRPTLATAPSTTATSCSGISCALGHAFGLDGSLPLIPIALFVVAALFILVYGIMREMGHPHAQG